MASSTETTATARFRAIVARALVFVLMVGPGIATWLAARRRYFNAEPLAGAAEASSQARPQCQGALATRYARPLDGEGPQCSRSPTRRRKVGRQHGVRQSEQFCTDCAPR
jgi:hypothetical protein